MQLTKELAYLVGALRDGSVSKFVDLNGKVHHSTTIYNNSLEWLLELTKLFKAVFGVNLKINFPRNRTPYIRSYRREIAQALHEDFEHPLKSQIGWKTPDNIIKNISFWSCYIAGFWDAEGGIDLQNKQVKFYLSWNGKNCPPLDDLKQMLESMNVGTGNVCKYENKNGNYPRFVLRVLKADTQKFVSTIPVLNEYKKNKLKIIGVEPQYSLPV